jgi:predicted Ser/Thr protein kinase
MTIKSTRLLVAIGAREERAREALEKEAEMIEAGRGEMATPPTPEVVETS